MTRRTDAEIIKPKGVGVSSPIPNTVEVIGPHRREGGQLRDNNLQFLSLTSYSANLQTAWRPAGSLLASVHRTCDSDL